MNNKKNYEIELLPCYKSYKAPPAPDLWKYANEYARHHGVLYCYDDIRLFSGTSREFLKAIERTEKADPNFKPYEVEKSVNHWAKNMSYARINFAITPSGQVFLRMGGWSFFKTIVWVKGAPHLRYMTDEVDGPSETHRHPDWQKTRRKLEVLEERRFLPAYKEARKAWVKEQKENGNWGEAQEKRKARRLAQQTNRKMAVCNQVTNLIQELEQYLKDINNKTATQNQVGQLYSEMMKLASLNKRVKTLFPKE